MIPNDNYVDWIIELARDDIIPTPFESVAGYGEEGATLQKSSRGIPAVNIGIPTRHGLSQSGVVDRADHGNTVRLVTAMLKNPTATAVESIRSF